MRPPRTGGLPLWAGHAMAAEELIARVRSVVGEEHLTTLPERLAARAVEGVSPAALVQPGSPEEVGDVLRAAGEAGGAVIPWGAGLHQHLGGIPRRADLIVETTRLQGITDYTPADYVVSVRTGTRLGEVQEALGAPAGGASGISSSGSRSPCRRARSSRRAARSSRTWPGTTS